MPPTQEEHQVPHYGLCGTLNLAVQHKKNTEFTLWLGRRSESPAATPEEPRVPCCNSRGGWTPCCNLRGTMSSLPQLKRSIDSLPATREESWVSHWKLRLDPSPLMQLERIPKTPTPAQEELGESASVQEEPYSASWGKPPATKSEALLCQSWRPQDITLYRGHSVTNRDEPMK